MLLSLSTLSMAQASFMLLIIGQKNVEDIFSLRLVPVHLYVLCLCLCECTPCKCRLPERSEEGRLPLRPEEDMRFSVA